MTHRKKKAISSHGVKALLTCGTGLFLSLSGDAIASISQASGVEIVDAIRSAVKEDLVSLQTSDGATQESNVKVMAFSDVFRQNFKQRRPAGD